MVRVHQQSCYGHQAYAAGHGCNVTCLRCYRTKIYIPFYFKSGFFCAIGNPGYADVNHICIFFNHVCRKKRNLAQSRHNNVGLQAQLFKVICAAMTECNSTLPRVVFWLTEYSWSAYNVASPDTTALFTLFLFCNVTKRLCHTGVAGTMWGNTLNQLPTLRGETRQRLLRDNTVYFFSSEIVLAKGAEPGCHLCLRLSEIHDLVEMPVHLHRCQNEKMRL